MLDPDVNVLVYAHREELAKHEACRRWLEETLAGCRVRHLRRRPERVVRVVTHPRVFKTPSPLEIALTFANAVREQPNCVRVQPGPRHWSIFERLCRESAAKGNIVADAYHAALAIEAGCEWVTMDRDYSRFVGLRWSSPFT